MEVRNCKGCGHLFNYMGGAPLCERCRKALEDKFQEVKQYLEIHPNSTVTQVSEALDISGKQIRQWIREERLALSAAGADGIVCEQCGTPICTGRYCEKCRVAMANTFAGAIAKPKQAEVKKERDNTNRMRFL